MPTFFRVLLSLCIFAIGLVLAAGMLAVSVMLVVAWGVRALYLKLTGRPAPPFTVRFTTSARARRKPPVGDVIDVEARQLP